MMHLGISTVDIYLTGACNYACEYCYGEDDRKSHMSEKVYEACLDFAQYIGADTIELCGGEPLLAPFFCSTVVKAKEKGFKLILRTNGIYLGDYIEFVAKYFDWVGVSLDGIAETNTKMRPSKNAMSAKEQFELPTSNIRRLKAINPNIKILLATVASRLNYDTIRQLSDYIEESKLPIDRWKVYQFIRDKFRSSLNYDKFALEQILFDDLSQCIPSNINGSVEVIFQSLRTEGAAGNCLLVYQDGTVKILDEYFGQIGSDSCEEICSKLSVSKVIDYIKVNKSKTYR